MRFQPSIFKNFKLTNDIFLLIITTKNSNYIGYPVHAKMQNKCKNYVHIWTHWILISYIAVYRDN